MAVRLITWNCQGGFRRKSSLVAAFQPDLAVIQECEHPERLSWGDVPAPSASAWVGNSPRKGLAVFSWTSSALSVMDVYDPGIRHCLPIQTGGSPPFTLLAIWAMDHPIGKLSYSAQIYQALSVYRSLLDRGDTVVMGDFNTNRKQSRARRVGSHHTMQTQMEDLWLFSAYHYFYHQAQGQESQGTYFRGCDPQKPSHIDYVYLPINWQRRLRQVRVGDPAVWLAHSDHCPLIVDLALEEVTSSTPMGQRKQ